LSCSRWLLLTATRDVNVYLGTRAEAPLRIRMGRAASGPLLNVLTGVGLIVAGRMLHGGWLTAFGALARGFGLAFRIQLPPWPAPRNLIQPL
jgi:hypothetical protein